jgi:hypothetical protein
MNEFHYSLIRFVPDAERMEPFNIGIILQGQGSLDFKLSPHVARRKDVDTRVFQKWRAFLEDEIRGDPVPLFQPSKQSISFFRHLASLCDGTVTISDPFFLSEASGEQFEAILESLYNRLVAPIDSAKREQKPRPTAAFREIEDEMQFRKRGMKKYPYVSLNGQPLWNAFRQVLNGENIVIDKVEVRDQVGLTADEIQKLASGADRFLERFLGVTCSPAPNRYILIADELDEKFTDQADEDYEVMREELGRVIRIVNSRGGQVLQRMDDVKSFAAEIDKKLPPPEDLKQAS